MFSTDPYLWDSVIIYFKNNLVVNVAMRGPYPPGFIFLGAFFLFFSPQSSYSAQYFFLKDLPILNLYMMLIFLISIQKRISKNIAFSIVSMLLVLSSKYFIYRTMMLLPSPIISLLAEILFLMFLIPNIPRELIFLTLGTAIIIHPVNGRIIFAFFILYEMVKKTTSLIPKLRKREYKGIIGKYIKNWIKNIWKYFILLCIPIAIYLMYGLYHSRGPTDLLAQLTPLLTNYGQVHVSFEELINWIPIWGSSAFLFSLICIFIPPKFYKNDERKKGFFLFLKISLIVGTLLFFLQAFTFLLNPFSGSEFISELLNILNSYTVYWITFRVFEILPIFFGILLTIVLEESFRWIVAKSWAFFDLTRANLHEILYCFLISLYFFQNVTQKGIYYEYVYSGQYPIIFLGFRDYLDSKNQDSMIVGYSTLDEDLATFVSSFLDGPYQIQSINLSISSIEIFASFINNPNCNINYLIITNVDNPYWSDIETTFKDSSYKFSCSPEIIVLEI